ncbi:MAG: hypothetical protein J6Q54_02080, partial [Oscillospiraceae bacterium]|nr:hypothetical protein [Oscillospiraceae bacterium]
MKCKLLATLLCLCLLTGCVANPIPGFGETKPTSVEITIKPLGFTDWYIRTNGYQENAEYPRVAVLNTTEELANYYEANKDIYDLEARIQTGVGTEPDLGFGNVTPRYDEAFFAENYVVLILLEEPSGSIRHKVASVSQFEDGRVGIAVERQVPEVGTDDMAKWHILV